MPTSLPMTTTSAAAARAAATVAADFGVTSAEPLILSDGANVIVHLRPSPVVAKVAATTMLVRPDVAAWLQRELDVVSFLARANAPVLAPSAEIPATTHTAGGHVMSFWRYHRPSGDALPGEAAIGSMLRDLHAALRGYPGRLGLLTPLDDIPRFLAGAGTQLSAADRAMLGDVFARLIVELDPGSCAVQPLHGDAGGGNLMAAGTGWIWHDFEDACSGPVTWDLAASTASQRGDRARILRAYGTSVDAAQLAVCEQLRRLHLTVWYALYAERLPEHRQRAAELLASWRVP
jgi:Ser/Thr protein kinase RdoA (MazF antagonist)